MCMGPLAIGFPRYVKLHTTIGFPSFALVEEKLEYQTNNFFFPDSIQIFFSPLFLFYGGTHCSSLLL